VSAATASDVRGVLSPEARLLLASADPGSQESPGSAAALIGEVREWGKLYGLSLRERAAGPLWTLLEEHRDRLPEEFARSLEQAAAIERLRQMQLERRLEESIEALECVDITPMLLKGAALVQTCYGDVRERPMGDIDLLVGTDEAVRARDALVAADWTWDRERFPEEMYDRHYHLPPLEDGRGSGVGLELHTGLFVPGHPLGFGPDDLRSRAEAIDVEGHAALVPHPEDHLVYVSLHFAWSHALGSAGWRTFRDAGRLARSSGFRWDGFVRVAEDAGAGPSAYWTLRMGRELAGGDVPDEVLRSLRPAMPGAVLGQLARHYALDLFEPEASCPSLGIRKLLWLVGNRWGTDWPGWPFGESSARPWDYSHDFRSLTDPGGKPDRGISSLRRHFGDRRRWAIYVRRVVLAAESGAGVHAAGDGPGLAS